MAAVAVLIALKAYERRSGRAIIPERCVESCDRRLCMLKSRAESAVRRFLSVLSRLFDDYVMTSVKAVPFVFMDAGRRLRSRFASAPRERKPRRAKSPSVSFFLKHIEDTKRKPGRA